MILFCFQDELQGIISYIIYMGKLLTQNYTTCKCEDGFKIDLSLASKSEVYHCVLPCNTRLAFTD